MAERDSPTNPSLADLTPLVGRWRIELYGASILPDPASRVASTLHVEWIENGAALAMRQGEDGAPPAALWIVGRDEEEPVYSVLYADARGVSRVYGMRVDTERWEMWRTTAGFSQRFEATLNADATMISGRWEKSIDGGATWEHDFNIDYIRE
jgi:hypothetical protein